MSYQKKSRLSCVVGVLFVLLADLCSFVKTDKELSEGRAEAGRGGG